MPWKDAVSKESNNMTPGVAASSSAPTITPASPALTWSLDEIQAFEAEAQKRMVDADTAEMEVKSLQECMAMIPDDVRRFYELPTNASECTLALKNIQRTKDRILTMVAEVKTAYVRHATSLVQKPAAKFGIDSADMQAGASSASAPTITPTASPQKRARAASASAPAATAAPSGRTATATTAAPAVTAAPTAADARSHTTENTCRSI